MVVLRPPGAVSGRRHTAAQLRDFTDRLDQLEAADSSRDRLHQLEEWDRVHRQVAHNLRSTLDQMLDLYDRVEKVEAAYHLAKAFDEMKGVMVGMGNDVIKQRRQIRALQEQVASLQQRQQQTAGHGQQRQHRAAAAAPAVAAADSVDSTASVRRR